MAAAAHAQVSQFKLLEDDFSKEDGHVSLDSARVKISEAARKDALEERARRVGETHLNRSCCCDLRRRRLLFSASDGPPSRRPERASLSPSADQVVPFGPRACGFPSLEVDEGRLKNPVGVRSRIPRQISIVSRQCALLPRSEQASLGPADGSPSENDK